MKMRMNVINRTAILFQPKQPFIDWLNKYEKSSYVYEIETRRSDASIYLIKEVENVKEIQLLIESKFSFFFEIELNRYPFDKKYWPDTSSFKVFEKWIDFTYHTIVLDVCDLPIKREVLPR